LQRSSVSFDISKMMSSFLEIILLYQIIGWNKETIKLVTVRSKLILKIPWDASAVLIYLYLSSKCLTSVSEFSVSVCRNSVFFFSFKNTIKFNFEFYDLLETLFMQIKIFIQIINFTKPLRETELIS
jgi:hypothetical protein